MKKALVLIIAVIALTGCTTTKTKMYDQNFNIIAQKFQQIDTNFKAIQENFATKDMIEAECPVCEPCEEVNVYPVDEKI